MTSTTELAARLGHQFNDETLLTLALTHKSYANERGENLGPTVHTDNERLEFLGDAVLDLALAQTLMMRFAQDPEGSLSRKRASLVNEETLAGLARELQLDSLIRLGRGEIKTGGLQKPRILASTLEALLGAVFLDGGYASAVQMVQTLFASRLEEISQSPVDFKLDFKTRLQEKVQEKHKATPVYQVESETGPDHDKKFEVSVRMDGQVLGVGTGRSKKAAEQEAARIALEQMDV